MHISHLRVNHLENPIGYDFSELNISYLVKEASGIKQEAAQIQIALDESFSSCVYDTGMTKQVNNYYNPIKIDLKPRTRYYYKVLVLSNKKELAESEIAFFETGKMKEEWRADFISPQLTNTIHPILTKRFEAKKGVTKARFYGLGLGIYELYLNGKKVSNEYLLPGLHAYDSWLQYQTFELEVIEGENFLEVMLGDGWYKGAYGLKSSLPRYGAEYAFICEIYLTYGKDEVLIQSDESFQVRKSKVLFDSIYDGEIFDDTIDETKAYPVKILDMDKQKLSDRLSPQIIIHERIKPIEVITTPKGETVLDFGQNMVGWVECNVSEPYGTKIILKYGEILQDQNFYQENLRTAKCEYTYIANGTPQTIRPHFTFYGFRFVKVEGFTKQINANDFTAMVIHSEMEETGTITTSNSLVNQLLSNVRWGQKGNFLDIPTDCPQRDERMGWTGDAQIFADTASYLMDTYAFYRKFMKDLGLEQVRLKGSVPYVVPMSAYELHGATTWGDAATVIPWVSYLHTNDVTILKQQYESMRGWVEYMRREDEKSGNKRLWLTGKHFGDWLALDGKVDGGVYGSTDKYFIASAFYYYSTSILAKTAKIINRLDDFLQYDKLAEEIKDAFIKEYFTPYGRLSVDTQTAYALVIFMDLYQVEWKDRLRDDFKEKMKENNFKLNTGFVGTPYLCLALSKCGLHEIAYDLLVNEEYPGWLYEVKMGATTIWERWNSVLPNGKISGTGMNSLNHYAYGSIVSWVYQYVVGITTTQEGAGFKKAIIAPNPSYHLERVDCKLMTAAGEYRVKWNLNTDHSFLLQVEIPFDAMAAVVLPRANTAKVSMYKGIAGEEKQSENIYSQYEWRVQEENLCVWLPAGSYHFSYVPNKSYRYRWSLSSNFNLLMQDEKAKEIILTYFPRAKRGIPFQGEASILEEILQSPFSEITNENIQRIKEELEQL